MSSDRGEDGNVRYTTDPTLLRSVVEDRNGYPAHVVQTEGQGDQGLLRVGFREEGEADSLRELSWDEFLEEFEEKDLVALYTDDGSDVDGVRPVVLRKREDVDVEIDD